MMDLKRYEKIEGVQAIKLLLEGERLLSEEGIEFRIDSTFNKLYHAPWAHEVLSDLSFNEIVNRNWFVKKTFDVRVEMLERPNEWVGAFKDGDDWQLVGFEHSTMSSWAVNYFDGIGEPFEFSLREYPTQRLYVDELDRCIPIEDVPEEELQ